MRILLLTYDFPPTPNAHAYRWFGVVQEWLKMGHHVDVISSFGTTDLAAKLIDHANFRLVRVGNHRINQVRDSQNDALDSARSPSAASRLKHLAKRIYRALYWPDGLWHWYFDAAKAALPSPAKRYDLVVSYSPTFVTHLLAMRMKNKGLAGAWLADYGDPFSFSPNMPVNNLALYHSLNLAMERRVLTTATASSFTNEATRAMYQQKFPDGAKMVIPHMVSIDEFDALRSSRSRSATPLLAYVGALHHTIREAAPTVANLAAALARKPGAFTVNFTGTRNGVEIPQHAFISVNPGVPRHEALPIMMQSDVLIHIENTGVPMSPSKLVDYIASGKPILNFHTGEVSPLLASWPYCLNLHVDGDNAAAILAFVDRAASPSRDEIAHQIIAHDVSAIAGNVLSIASEKPHG